jgi:hypothetical protein
MKDNDNSTEVRQVILKEPPDALPTGFRKLNAGSILKDGDLWWDSTDQEFKPTNYSGDKVHQGFYIRKEAK